MKTISIEAGFCLGFGASNAREATCINGDIVGFSAEKTPNEPDAFFRWMARKLLVASHAGNEWLVAGYPGPVSSDGGRIGPFANIGGMEHGDYDVRERLMEADPEVGRVIDQGFVLLNVNDGTLSAQAAAKVTKHNYNKTGALIFGTGVGAGVVNKDPNYTNVHRNDTSNPYEIGHLVRSADPFDRFEDRHSGPGIEKRYGARTEDLPADHPVWKEQGEAVGILATYLGNMNGVEVVVPCGGVGASTSDKYMPHLERFMEAYRHFGNGAQKKYAPEIMLVPSAEANVFEMRGAEGVMLDYVTRAA